MCLTIELFSRKKIAKEDIEVFKVLRRDDDYIWRTPYLNAIANFNVPMKSHLYRSLMSVNKGIHSYSTRAGAMKAMRHMGEDNIWQWFLPDEFRIFKAIIPKGSEYYVGKHEYFADYYTGSYASNQLIILNEYA